MGGKSEKGESMDWTDQNTKVFIEIIYDRVKKGQLQGSTFKMTIWEDINNELCKITGATTSYGVDRLKGKFNRLRLQHREFSTLLSRTGVTWDLESNKVNAPEEVWEDLYTKGKYYKQFKKHEFEHDYDILGEIFNSSTTTGKLSQASTQEPPNSDDEKEIEGNFLSKGVHVETDVVDVDGGDLQEIGTKRKGKRISSEHRQRETRNSRLKMLDVALSQWSEAMSARAEASKAKANRYKAQAASTITDFYSVDACMELLDSMKEISDNVYNKALDKFINQDWRVVFIKMSSYRRNKWLASLDE